MRTSTRLRAAAVAMTALVVGVAAAGARTGEPSGFSAAPAPRTCPLGQHEDTQTPGFPCVPGWCPPGMLLDGVTHSCVAAPGVPPPALAAG